MMFALLLASRARDLAVCAKFRASVTSCRFWLMLLYVQDARARPLTASRSKNSAGVKKWDFALTPIVERCIIVSPL